MYRGCVPNNEWNRLKVVRLYICYNIVKYWLTPTSMDAHMLQQLHIQHCNTMVTADIHLLAKFDEYLFN